MFLKQKDFAFAPYSHEGFSGQKLLATRKSDGQKFIVKSASAECACNEFLYFSIAKEFGLRTLDFYLFEKDERCKTFTTGYAIAIEYIEDASHIGSKSLGISKNPMDYFAHRALASAFWEGDTFEMLTDKNHYIYRIDPTESFGVDGVSIRMLDIGFKNFPSRVNHIISSISSMSSYINENHSSDECAVFKDTLEKLYLLPIKKIESIVDTICQLYPKPLKQVYMNYFEDFKAAYESVKDCQSI